MIGIEKFFLHSVAVITSIDNMLKLRAVVQRSGEKEQKQQSIDGTEIILLKGYATTSDQNYDQESSGWPDSGAVWNSLRSESFLECHVFPLQLQVLERRGLHLKERASRTPNTSCEPRIRSPDRFGDLEC
ncbi:hypothetical protein TNCV_301731 [Trichonephila clavipes]|nr:hypothetical protein TNCV_301731 [Trichonephila clavipes]